MSANKRLQKEQAQLASSTDDTISLRPHKDDIRRWTATIKGPNGSYYEGYSFDLKIDVPHDYPMTPPNIMFKTKIFHPNVLFENGEICLDILKKEWSPAWSLQSACRAIISLLDEPAADSPLNCDAGNMLRAGDIRAYRSVVTMYCKDHCHQN